MKLYIWTAVELEVLREQLHHLNPVTNLVLHLVRYLETTMCRCHDHSRNLFCALFGRPPSLNQRCGYGAHHCPEDGPTGGQEPEGMLGHFDDSDRLVIGLVPCRRCLFAAIACAVLDVAVVPVSGLLSFRQVFRWFAVVAFGLRRFIWHLLCRFLVVVVFRPRKMLIFRLRRFEENSDTRIGRRTAGFSSDFPSKQVLLRKKILNGTLVGIEVGGVDPSIIPGGFRDLCNLYIKSERVWFSHIYAIPTFLHWNCRERER